MPWPFYLSRPILLIRWRWCCRGRRERREIIEDAPLGTNIIDNLISSFCPATLLSRCSNHNCFITNIHHLELWLLIYLSHNDLFLDNFLVVMNEHAMLWVANLHTIEVIPFAIITILMYTHGINGRRRTVIIEDQTDRSFSIRRGRQLHIGTVNREVNNIRWWYSIYCRDQKRAHRFLSPFAEWRHWSGWCSHKKHGHQ